MVSSIWQDLRHATRSLLRSPALAVTAVLSLAVGIAGNAAVFSLADALLVRGRPGIADPARLVDVGRTIDGSGFDNFSYPNYIDYRDRNTVFDGLAGYKFGVDALGFGSGDGAERVYSGIVSGNYFSVLGVPMALGRGFTPDEDQPDRTTPVTVLSHAFWRARLAADPGAVGRTILLNGRAFTVVGVTAPGFVGNTIAAPDLWVPLTMQSTLLGRIGSTDLLTLRRGVWMVAIGRLATGVTIEQARAQMERIAADLERTYPSDNRGHGVALAPSSRVPGDFRTATIGFLGVLFALVGLILLIACTNVGGMLLARGVMRAREVAIRLALGSARGRIVRLVVTESLLLALLGGVAGILGAIALVDLLRTAVPALPMQVVVDFRLDWRVVAFSVGLSLVAGVLFGLLPALETAKTDLVSTIKTDGASRGPRRLRLRQTFVVAQVALSVLLVVCALLLGRSLLNAAAIDPGFVLDGVHMAEIDVRLAGYENAAGLRVAEDLVAGMSEVPGVRSVAASRVVPLSGSGLGLGPLRLPGQPEDEENAIRTDWNVVTPGYFETLQIPLVQGRAFNGGDRTGAPNVAIVNATFARRVWPGQDPVGQRLAWSSVDGPREIQVIGVARDAKYRSLGEEPRPFIYVPLAQHFMSDLWLMMRADGQNPIPTLQALVKRIDPNLPIVEAGTLEALTAFNLVPHRVAAWIAGSVGVIGLLLACIGVYGITSHSVLQRTREIGIRVALGALRGRVLGMIVRQAMTLAGIGALLGLMAAALATQLLTSYLYGLKPLDPISFAGGALLLALMALVASLLPARRAAALDPVVALKVD